MEMTDFNHATNIGLIALHLAAHAPGDWGDSSINDPVTTLVDREQPAHVLLQALAHMSPERAAGIIRQITCTASVAA
jgi:hypothetical protein